MMKVQEDMMNLRRWIISVVFTRRDGKSREVKLARSDGGDVSSLNIKN